MKFLVDEMPHFKEDCLFAEQEWSDEEEVWVNFCKLTTVRCDLNEKKCSCLKVQGADDGTR